MTEEEKMKLQQREARVKKMEQDKKNRPQIPAARPKLMNPVKAPNAMLRVLLVSAQ